jgi:hypothetical protein
MAQIRLFLPSLRSKRRCKRAVKILVRYVKPHPESGILIYRRQFPADLKSYVPGKVQGVKRSLGAKAMTAGAAMALAAASAEYDQLVTQARKAFTGSFDPLGRPLIGFLTAQFLHEALGDDERARKALSPIARTYEGRKDPEEDYIESRTMLVGRHGEHHAPSDPTGFDRPGIVDHWGPWVQDYSKSQGKLFDPQTEAFGDLCEAIAGAACDLWLAIDRRNDGKPDATPAPPMALAAPIVPKASVSPCHSSPRSTPTPKRKR